MSKEKNAKKIRIIAMIVIGLVVIGVVCFILLRKKEEAYRNIRVVEVVGEATVQREEIPDLKVYENMNLQSGDVVYTGEKSKVTLRLDDDKYVVIDENSKLTLQAEGTAEDSKTSITLEYGAIFTDIQNKLSEKSDFIVVAPHSVASVRGTQFEVVYRELKDGEGNIVEKLMKVLIFEGKVSVKPEGSEEKRITKAGFMEVLKENADGTYGFAAETKQIEAEDLSNLSATYLKEALSETTDNLTEEEKDLRDFWKEKVEEFFHTDFSKTEEEEPVEKDEPAEEEEPVEVEDPAETEDPAEPQEPEDSDELLLFNIKYYSLMFMENPATFDVTTKEEFLQMLSPYELGSQRSGMAVIEWNKEVGFAEQIAKMVQMDDQMLRSAEAIFEEPVQISCDGFYDDYLNLYGKYSPVNMSEVSTTINPGDTLNLYPMYYVEGESTGMKASYIPCIITVKEGGTNTSYAVMFKAADMIGLPELTDCTLTWTGGTSNGQKKVSASGVNRMGIVITE